MEVLNTIIVDDEKNNIDLLLHFIKKYCPNIKVIKTCLTYDDALYNLKVMKPDLVFLDIVLDRDNSFMLLNELGDHPFKIIFTTAYDEYAIRAFKYEAVGYLLKPVMIEDLIQAVDKINKSSFLEKEQIVQLSNKIMQRHPSNFITISGMDKVEFFLPDEIICLKSSGRYTEIYTVDRKGKITTSKAIGEFETILDPGVFYRIHNPYIINLNHLKLIDKKGGNYCFLTGGHSLPVSRRRMEGLMGYLKNKI